MKAVLGVFLLAGCTPINSDVIANGLTGIARDAVDKAMLQPSQRTQPAAQAVPAAAQQPAPRKLQLKGKLLSSAIASGKSVEELDVSVQKAAEDLLSGR